LARFLIAAFHGLVRQTEWNKGLSVEPRTRIQWTRDSWKEA
jgi:hypothetical protein